MNVIDEALDRLLAQQPTTSEGAAVPGRGRLWDAVASAAEGGKRFRPTLVLATHDALGGTCRSAAVKVGAAIELLHTALVIHDDVIDGDEVRRGRLNVSGTYAVQARGGGASEEDAAALGRAAGMLAGDLALAAAIRAVAVCGAPPEVVRALLDLVDSILHTTAEGELADVRLSLHLDSTSLTESLAMEQHKTGAYSFVLPLQAGALIAGADASTVLRLGEAGRDLGLAFQLVDDLVGVFGDPTRTGKSTTSDLRANKQTPLLVHAASTPEWDLIRGYLGRDLTGEELVEARRLLTASGSRRFVEDLVEAHLLAGRAALAELGISIDEVLPVAMSRETLADGNTAVGKVAAA